MAKRSSYTLFNHQNHNVYLDTLKKEFQNMFENPPNCKKIIEDFDIIKPFGKGAFGQVFLIRDKTKFTYHAMKVVEKEILVERNLVEHILLEKKLMQCVKFPFIVTLDYVYKDNVYLYFIMPYSCGGEIFTHIHKNGSLSEQVTKFYAGQMVLALEYLHHCCIIHRDVKPENILLEPNGYIKLTDFGFCKIIKNRTWTLCGTPEYLAPEIILSNGYSFPVDWWALGTLIFEMCVGCPPFTSTDINKLYEKIIEGAFKCPNHVSVECKNLLKGLLQVEPSRRYGCLKNGTHDIKSHPWFADINWHLLLQQELPAPYIPTITGPEDTSHFLDLEWIKLKKSSFCKYETEFAEF